MIRRFRHRGLERFFEKGDPSGINFQQSARFGGSRFRSNSATAPAGMNLPGYRLHKLRGYRGGQWAVSVSGNWRLVFEFEDDSATNVDLVDYH